MAGSNGLPAIARATSKFQYLCVNGRFIRDRNLGHAIKEGYRGLVPPDRQPVAVVRGAERFRTDEDGRGAAAGLQREAADDLFR